MEHIRLILEKKLRQMGIHQHVDAARIIKEAQNSIGRIFSPFIASAVTVVSLKDGLLRIKTNSPVIGQEIKFKEQELLQELKKRFPDQKIQGIRFVL